MSCFKLIALLALVSTVSADSITLRQCSDGQTRSVALDQCIKSDQSYGMFTLTSGTLANGSAIVAMKTYGDSDDKCVTPQFTISITCECGKTLPLQIVCSAAAGLVPSAFFMALALLAMVF
eukprot:TRINITY_DN2160_c0_g1_i1.p1 TRINITY_DN2160_c0_g1~~TRINITY_DN2160_c0_g1_i1.p1  ORF type:complete len:121 (+),score=19.54 TRINITY_DN2160_c0_g1_i1:75-437(+)